MRLGEISSLLVDDTAAAEARRCATLRYWRLFGLFAARLDHDGMRKAESCGAIAGSGPVGTGGRPMVGSSTESAGGIRLGRDELLA